MKMPEKLNFANLPTKIEKLERLSDKLNKNIYLKRDDQTGSEISGNKIRKLEYAIKEALDNGCDYLITCGGLGSNHARATTAIAAKLGIGSYLVLRGEEDAELEGNLFLDKILGAKIKWISKEEYAKNRTEIMEAIREELYKKGHNGYIIPEGASNGIGSFGYINAMKEIEVQEKEMGVYFDSIIVPVGSGGSYAGLFYRNHMEDRKSKIYGVNVSSDAEHFKEAIMGLLEQIDNYTGEKIGIEKDQINIIDGYVGKGYALSTKEEIDFISNLARTEGLVLDPVYTGKAMYGMVEEIKKGNFSNSEDILFIHTGGIFGWNRFARELL